MMECRRRGLVQVLWSVCALGLFCGCPKAPEYPKGGTTDKSAVTDVQEGAELEHFDPPSLDELNSQVEWEDQRVIDSMAELRKRLEAEPQLATVEEALKLRNNSPEDNAKILSALGRPFESRDQMADNAEASRLLKADINSINPLLQSSVYETYVVGLTSLGFFSFDWKMVPFAPSETVVSWQTSKDKLYDKVVIRDDLKWSDGKPVTAHDVEFSFKLIMNPKVPIPAVRAGMDAIRWVQAYDDRTFVIFHKESLATNVWNCNFPTVPKHVFENSVNEDSTLTTSAYHQKFEENPVCGGPYRVARRSKGQEIILERRDDWFMHNGKEVRSKPHFKRIRFRVITQTSTAQLALNEGKIEDMELEPQVWMEQTNDDAFYRLNTKVRGLQWTYYYFGWNMKTPYFSDERVRKAMSYAVNYDHILNTLCYGLYERCNGDYHPDSLAVPRGPRTPYTQDLAKAEELLKEAGWVDNDGDGVREKMINGQKVRFDFNLMCANEQLRIDICTSLAESLGRLGIACQVQPTEFTVMQQKSQDRSYHAMFGGWGTGADPSTTENLWKTGEQRNFSNYSDPRVDALFQKARAELDPVKRGGYFREIDEILWEAQPYTWLYYRSGFWGFNKRWRGYSFSPRGPYSFSPGFDSIWPAVQ